MALYAGLWVVLFVLSHWGPDSVSKVNLTLMLGPTGHEPIPTPQTFDLWRVLALNQIGAAGMGDSPGFQIWQVLTAPLVYPPSSAGFSSLLIGFLGFIFFAAPVERLLGLRAFLQLWVVAAAGGVLGGVVLAVLIGAPIHFGFAPSVLAVMAVHCVMTPEATVPLFVVVHVKMKWFAAAIAALVVVRALALTGGGVGGGYEGGGLLAGWLWWRSRPDLDPRRMLRRRRARKNLRVAVDRLVQPGADDDDDGPIFH